VYGEFGFLRFYGAATRATRIFFQKWSHKDINRKKKKSRHDPELNGINRHQDTIPETTWNVIHAHTQASTVIYPS